MVKVTLKDDVVKEFQSGTTVMDIAKSIGMGLYKAACLAKIDGETCDLRTPVTKDCHVEILTFDDEDGKKAFWHTTSHILAQAVKRLYPSAKLAIGPSIANGFYYDFDVDFSFTPEILEKIEAEMKKIVKENITLEQFDLSADEALKLMEEKDEPYKVELIKEHAGKGEKISFYKQAEFTELCAGPHIPDTGRVKAFKLTSIAGAYWRGDEKNKMLQRIYGISFTKQSELTEYLERIEEAKKRDHRKLGKELGLFALRDEAPGMPFFLPNGMILRNTLIDYWHEVHERWGYLEISTPQIMKRSLWETSGHWDHYKDNMYTTVIDGEDFAIKPMNCPGHVLIYRNEIRSYRDLPLRLFEFGTVYRHELSGAVHGLLRARGFTQDDAHVFCTKDQVVSEVVAILDLVDHIMSTFGFEYMAEISTRPEKSIGSDEMWEHATNSLMEACKQHNLDYEINEGDGAFYGPKIDIKVKDAIGRTWQCSTVQVDFNFPERFDLTYRTADNTEERPWMLHRAIFGSIERFFGILIEHYSGALPLWLAPVQVVLLPLADRHLDACKDIAKKIKAAGGRVEVYEQNEPMRVKIAKAQNEKIPYMCVVGDKELEAGTISVRERHEGDLGTWEVEQLLEIIREASL